MIKKILKKLERLKIEKEKVASELSKLSLKNEKIDNEIKTYIALKKDYEKIEKKFNEMTTIKEGNTDG